MGLSLGAEDPDRSSRDANETQDSRGLCLEDEVAGSFEGVVGVLAKYLRLQVHFLKLPVLSLALWQILPIVLRVHLSVSGNNLACRKCFMPHLVSHQTLQTPVSAGL